ncbi:hypothetical protein PAHAL_3G279900 [Panicum hallii]|uniref:Uncharacterized protein n=1 Tax=Panicum hallii TaxID=206008 RepID=A0A2T8KJM2_9POAL|nr:hypothetical protein PAHAL_3G279900 [Panicum hallii]
MPRCARRSARLSSAAAAARRSLDPSFCPRCCPLRVPFSLRQNWGRGEHMSAAEVAGGAARAGKSRESRIGICKVPSGLLLPRPGNNAALVSVHPGSCCCQDAHYRLHAQWSWTCGWRVSEIHFGTFLVFSATGFSRFLWSGLWRVAPSGQFHHAEPRPQEASQTDRPTTDCTRVSP